MEGQFKNTLIGFILISLFGMMLLSGVVTIAGNYEKETTEIVGGSMSLSKFNDTISNIETDARAKKKTFEEGSIWSIGGVVVTGIFGLTKSMIEIIFLPFGVLMGIAENVLKIPVYVTSVLMAIVIFGLIFGVWRLIKIGD